MMKNRIEDSGFRIQDSGFRIQDGEFTSPLCMQHEVRRAESRILNPESSKGFSLISAIFLLVVIAALGTFAVTISTTQHQSAALDVIGARAYQAARVGVEWGVYQVLPASGAAFATTCRSGPTSQVVAPLPNTLAGFDVNVECSATSHDEGSHTAAGGNPLLVYQLTSTAKQGVEATPNYVERRMVVTIATAQ